MGAESSLLKYCGGDLLDTALFWWEAGQATIPVKPNKLPAIVSWTPYMRRLPTFEEIHYWYVENSPQNIGLIPSGNLAVLDFDEPGAYEIWKSTYGICSYEVTTGRGIHAYFLLDEPYHKSFDANLDGHKIEVKTAGTKYVLCPPSIHPTGKPYTGNDQPIAHIQKLADVVPVEAPRDTTKQPYFSNQVKTTPAPEHKTYSPWEEVSNPEAANRQALADKARAIKAKFRPMDFLTTPIKPTSNGFGMTCCPLHDDHNPSMVVNLAGVGRPDYTGMVRCLSGCCEKKWLDTIVFYAALRGIPHVAAILELEVLL